MSFREFKDKLKKTGFGKVLTALYPYKLKDYIMRRSYAKYDIKKYLGNDVPPEREKELVKKMLKIDKETTFEFFEFFLYDLEHLTPAERNEFISDNERIFYCRRLNREENLPIFNNKDMTYEYFKDFYHRDFCKINDKQDFAKFEEFFKKHQDFIGKPANSSFGSGVKVFRCSGKTAEEAFKELIKFYVSNFIVEELIVQCAELSELHPKSVNSMRMPTVRLDDRVEVFHPFLRIGQGNSIVDNAGSGGIICAVDVETGVVTSAADELGRQYTVHPDSGIELIGFKVPRWEEAKAFVKELAMVVPTNRYTGWDIALTDEGWLMVEGNANGQFVDQIPTKKGVKAELEALLKELNL